MSCDPEGYYRDVINMSGAKRCPIIVSVEINSSLPPVLSNPCTPTLATIEYTKRKTRGLLLTLVFDHRRVHHSVSSGLLNSQVLKKASMGGVKDLNMALD